MRNSSLVLLAVLVTSLARAEEEPVVAEDTTVPNEYTFSQAEYFVAENATNAVIEVHFSPGNRSYTGSVNFSATAGTAIAGEDFQPVSGTLNYAGLNVRTFTVPIYPDCKADGGKTVLLRLHGTSADRLIISNAVLRIQDGPCVPKLQTIRTNSKMRMSWRSEATGFVLEKALSTSGPWQAVNGTVALTNNTYVVEQEMNGIISFYRLRKTAP